MEYQPRLNTKYMLVLHCISNFEKVLLWKDAAYYTSSFSFCYFTSACISTFLQLFRTLLNIIWKKISITIFPFLTDSPNPWFIRGSSSPPPLFKAPTPWTSLPPFKNLYLPPLISVPAPSKVFPHPHTILSCPNPTKQPFLV